MNSLKNMYRGFQSCHMPKLEHESLIPTLNRLHEFIYNLIIYILLIQYIYCIISIIFCISHSEIDNKKYNIVIAISDLGTSHKVGGSTCVGWHHGCQPATNEEEEEEGEDWVLNPPRKPCGLACNAVFCRTSLNSLCAMGQGVFCGFPTSDIILFSNYIIIYITYI